MCLTGAGGRQENKDIGPWLQGICLGEVGFHPGNDSETEPSFLVVANIKGLLLAYPGEVLFYEGPRLRKEGAVDEEDGVPLARLS